MFITKKHIPRRTFLYGSGVTLALPLLEAMLPAQTPQRLTAANPATRFTAIFVPHGAAPGKSRAGAPWWVPETEGTAFKFPFIMEPLEPHRDRVVLFSGLHAKSAEPPAGTTGSDHFVAAAFLCANKPKKTTGLDINVGAATIDQMIAEKIGQETLLPSMQLAVEDPGASSSCGEGIIAPIPTRSRGGPRTSRFPWSSIRRWCSNVCSATAARRKNGRLEGSSSAAFWTW